MVNKRNINLKWKFSSSWPVHTNKCAVVIFFYTERNFTKRLLGFYRNLYSSSSELVILWGCNSAVSCVLMFLWGLLPVKSSSYDVVFLQSCLPTKLSSVGTDIFLVFISPAVIMFETSYYTYIFVDMFPFWKLSLISYLWYYNI